MLPSAAFTDKTDHGYCKTYKTVIPQKTLT